MLYLLAAIAPIMSLFALYSDVGWIQALPILYVFGLIPVLDLVFAPKYESALSSANLDRLLYAVCFFYLAIWSLFIYEAGSMGLVEAVIKGVNLGISCGVIGINCAHELGHRTQKRHQNFAKLLLLTSSYSHFFIEHNKGHHRNVSTPDDPASSRLNESIYQFLPRTIIGSFLSARKIESHKPWKKNEFFHLMLWQTAFILAVFIVSGLSGLVLYACSSMGGILLLESVNYIEHYGLSRNPKGKWYERVTPLHSWNSDHLFARLHLFDLTRHSDHHAIASKPFYDLKSIEKAPQLPTGYAGMVVLSLVPNLWFKVMNKHLVSEQKRLAAMA